MSMRRALLAALALWLAASPAHAADYSVEPPADWVVPGDYPGGFPEGAAPPERSDDYLLVDRQLRLGQKDELYYRYVQRPLNAAAVADDGTVQIGYDPAHEQLRVHAVTLLRADRRIDGLKVGRIEVLRREPSLDEGLVDGRLTFHLVLPDVRVGDIIDVSYTLVSSYPEWGSAHYGELVTRWSEPVAESRLRLLSRPGEPLQLRPSEGDVPAPVRSGEWDVREWRWGPVAELDQEKDTPSHYEQHPRLQFSSFASWDEVRERARTMFAVALPGDAETTALVARLRSAGSDDGARIVAVMKFVQEEVRYTGIEIGEGAFRPTEPAAVLARRYGDCKDKTLLAVALMRALGIEADPALVSTHWNRNTHTRLPSPDSFNHAIVRVRLDGRAHWYDATWRAQGGDFAHFEETHPGEALALGAGDHGLQEAPWPAPAAPLVRATAEFDLSAGARAPGTLHITTRYAGPEADGMRNRLRTTRLEELARQYLDYYRKRYPELQADGPLAVDDDTVANSLVVTEKYRLPQGFRPGDDGGLEFEAEAEAVNEHLAKVAHTVRRLPLELDWPVWTEQQVRLRLPGQIEVGPRTQAVASPYFDFHREDSVRDGVLVYDFSLRGLQDEVPVAALDSYRQQREQARLATYFTLTHTEGDAKDPAAAKAAAAELEAVRLQLRNAQGKPAQPLLERIEKLLAAPGFDDLDATQRHLALSLAGAVAFDAQSWQKALEHLRGACSLPGSSALDWQMRLFSARRLKDATESTLSLTELALRHPEKLAGLDRRMVSNVMHDTPRAGVARYRLLSALRSAKYDPPYLEMSLAWSELAALQIERGELAEAAQTLQSVTFPYTIVRILSDARYRPALARLPHLPDPASAAEASIAARRAAAQQAPDVLEAAVRLAQALEASNRPGEGLAVLDDALARALESGGAKAFKDGEQQYPWLLDERAVMLFALGRTSESVEQMKAASHLGEDGHGNVSQVLDLATLLNLLGRPGDALGALAGFDPAGANAKGLMIEQLERFLAAVQLGDEAAANKAYDYLREHEADSPAALTRALLYAGRLDEAAVQLVRRLEDADLRGDALEEIQEYADEPVTARGKAAEAGLRSVLARPEVAAAVARVGRVARYPLRNPAD